MISINTSHVKAKENLNPEETDLITYGFLLQYTGGGEIPGGNLLKFNYVVITIVNNAINIDGSLGNVFSVVIPDTVESVTINKPTNVTDIQPIWLYLYKQSASTLIDFNSDILFPNGTTPDLSNAAANSTHLLCFWPSPFASKFLCIPFINYS